MSNRHRSVIEVFPVELWKEVFDYFIANDLWYSFRGINTKIDGIIDQTILYLNFENKDSYDYFMKNILPTMNVANIRSLKFEKTIEMKHFFSVYSLNSLVQLRLLSSSGMCSFDDNSFMFWNQLSSLKYLRSLKIDFHDYDDVAKAIEEKEFIIRSIFNQNICPLLESFAIGTPETNRWDYSIPSLIKANETTNIKYLSIDSLTLNDLNKLLPALRNVKSFKMNYMLTYKDRFTWQQHEMIIATPLMCKCVRLELLLSYDVRLQHVEYILKHTPNIKELLLWGWKYLLDAKKWEILLSTYCSKLLQLKFVCAGSEYESDFYQVGRVFQEECKTRPFWLERNVRISHKKNYTGYDDIIIELNIKK